MRSINRSCAECGKPFKARQYNAQFCGKVCRAVFNNRRAMRGQAAYDLLMLGAEADTKGELKKGGEYRDLVDQLVAKWRQDDAGRRTHKSATEVHYDVHALLR